jgi:hypothetical protein
MLKRKALLLSTVLASNASTPVIPDLELPTTNRLYYFYGGNGSSKPSGITASGDGGAISSWLDKDSLVTVSQGTGSAQPTYRLSVAGLNNRGAAEFDGGDTLQAAVGVLSLVVGDWTWALVIKTSHAANGTIVSEGRSSSNTPFIRFDTAINDLTFSMRDNASTSANPATTTDINNNAARLLLATKIGTTLSIYIDNMVTPNATASTATLGALTTDRLTFGALGRAALTEFWDGQIALCAAWAGDQLSAGATIKTHYGIA